MHILRIAFLLLAVSLAGCAQVIQARLSSAHGSIDNESEHSFRVGTGTKRIMVLADLFDQDESIKSANRGFSSTLYNTLSGYGYAVKQFQPSSKAERDQYLAKLEADMARDPGLLVVRMVPKAMIVQSRVNEPSAHKVPKTMEFAANAYVGTLRSPAFAYSGKWTYDGDFYFNSLAPMVTEHLIKAGYLAQRSKQ